MPNSPLSLDVEQVRCTLKDMLPLAEQIPYDRSSVVLSDSPGTDYYGAHKDRYVQLPIRVMIGNGIMWALMITILTNPTHVRHGRWKKHTVRKFKVPEYIVELLEGMPFVTGFGIKEDVLAIEDTFSLMVGQDLKLCGFVELGSLCLYAGWGFSTVNMPAAHCMLTVVTGSLLNKLVSEADDEWGKPWEAISELMRVYAIADVKHGHVLWNTLVGCIIRDLFPDPEAALYLTGTDQREFVAEFNTLLVEALAGTEIQMNQLLSAQSRKDIAQCICYRTQTRAISSGPPSRVEVLTRFYSPWSNISYGGCRYLRQAGVETLRKYEVLHEYVASRDNESMFSRALVDEDRRNVLQGLLSSECHPTPDLPVGGVPLRSWGQIPSHGVPSLRFGARANIQDWTRFIRTHDRPMKACILEWILMDPS